MSTNPQNTPEHQQGTDPAAPGGPIPADTQDDGGRRTENPAPAPQETAAEAGRSGPSGERYGRNDTARNPNADPDPAAEPVTETSPAPGETPPESNSATATPPNQAPSQPPKSNTVLVGAIVAIVVLVLFFFIAYIVGLIG
ncbi:DUF6480 family protein [Nesterenkonia populi]|uniref:DUF6480 family protein n=1 Tax=Nesterenkonia populi TaxID=1591087 RepID=UPI0011BD4E92|nr:DUF6480 family protein [Nesterenkonia populi]